MGLKDLFFKSPNGDSTVKDQKKTPVINPELPGSIKSNEFKGFNIPTSNAVTGVLKQEIVDYFKKVFVENNIPGPDYQEFKNALEAMKSQPMDEATKIKTIWISFQTMGLTAQKLIDTAGQYKKLFAGKLAQFDGELQTTFDEQVTAKQKESDAILDENKKIDDDMRKLNEKKLANEAKAKELGVEIQKSTSELNQHKNDWHAVYDDLVKDIDADIDLINRHLVDTTPVK